MNSMCFYSSIGVIEQNHEAIQNVQHAVIVKIKKEIVKTGIAKSRAIVEKSTVFEVSLV